MDVDEAVDHFEPGQFKRILKWRRQPIEHENDEIIEQRQYLVERYGDHHPQWETMESLLGVEGVGFLQEDMSPSFIEEAHSSLLRNVVPCDWTMSHIVDERLTPNGVEFLVKWEIFPEKYNSWEPYSSFEASKEKISEFRRRGDRQALGALGFDRFYWDRVYDDNQVGYIKGATNSLSLANFVFWTLHTFGMADRVKSIADFGFGKGTMLESFAKVFCGSLERVWGIEPSPFAFQGFLAEKPHRKPCFEKLHCQFECVDVYSYVMSDVHVLSPPEWAGDDVKEDEAKGQRQLWVKPQAPSQSYNIDMTPTHLQFCGISKKLAKREGTPRDAFHPALRPMSTIDQINEENIIQSKTRRVTGNSDDEPRRSTRVYRRERRVDPEGVFFGGASACSCEDKWTEDGVYSLAIFCGVAHYLSDDTLAIVLHRLSYLCDYLYFHALGEDELRRWEDSGRFVDEYAVRRPKKAYADLLRRDWTWVSNGLFESKRYWDESTHHVGTDVYRN